MSFQITSHVVLLRSFEYDASLTLHTHMDYWFTKSRFVSGRFIFVKYQNDSTLLPLAFI